VGAAIVSVSARFASGAARTPRGLPAEGEGVVGGLGVGRKKGSYSPGVGEIGEVTRGGGREGAPDSWDDGRDLVGDGGSDGERGRGRRRREKEERG
jgi:hypothetical protein